MSDPTDPESSPMIEDEPMDTPAVATMVGASPLTLRQWRRRGTGPRWYRAGDRLVRYRRSAVVAWLAEQERAAAEPRVSA